MGNKTPLHEIKKKISLSEGKCLILLDRLAMEETYGKLECARNLYLVDLDDNVLWQVRSDFDDDAGPFTNFSISNNIIRAYRWDGGTYSIDVASGFAAPDILSR